MAVIGGFRSDLSITRKTFISLSGDGIADIRADRYLIRGRQKNSQIIVSGVPSRRDKKYKGRLIAGYQDTGFDSNENRTACEPKLLKPREARWKETFHTNTDFTMSNVLSRNSK